MIKNMFCRLCKKPIGSNGYCRDCLTYSGIEISKDEIKNTNMSINFITNVKKREGNSIGNKQESNYSIDTKPKTKTSTRNRKYVPKEIPKYICPYCKEKFNSVKAMEEHLDIEKSKNN